MPDAVQDYLRAIGKRKKKVDDDRPDFSDVAATSSSTAKTASRAGRASPTGDAVLDYLSAAGRDLPADDEPRGVRAGVGDVGHALTHPGETLKGMAHGIAEGLNKVSSPVEGAPKNILGNLIHGRPQERVTKENTPNAVTPREFGKGAFDSAVNIGFALAPELALPLRAGVNAGLGALNSPEDRLRGATAGLVLGETLHGVTKGVPRIARKIGSMGDVSEGVMESAFDDMHRATKGTSPPELMGNGKPKPGTAADIATNRERTARSRLVTPVEINASKGKAKQEPTTTKAGIIKESGALVAKKKRAGILGTLAETPETVHLVAPDGEPVTAASKAKRTFDETFDAEGKPRRVELKESGRRRRPASEIAEAAEDPAVSPEPPIVAENPRTVAAEPPIVSRIGDNGLRPGETAHFPPEPDIQPVVSANGTFEARPGVVRRVNRELAESPRASAPIRDEAGALRRDFKNVADGDLEAEHARLSELNAAEEAAAASVRDAGYRANYEELPRTERLGRKGQEDLPDADGTMDPDKLAADNKILSDYNKNAAVRQARANAIKRIEAELAARKSARTYQLGEEGTGQPERFAGAEPDQLDDSFDFGENGGKPEPEMITVEEATRRIEAAKRAGEGVTPERVQELEKTVEDERNRRVNAEREKEVDSLTGAGNQGAFKKALPTAEADPNTSIVRVDVNGFKAVNDVHGHPAGDVALTEVSDAMTQAAQEMGIAERVFRVGGDEFAAIVPKDVADAFRARAEQIYGVKDHGEGVRTSISGGVGATDAAADVAALAQKAAHKAEQGIGGRETATARPGAPADAPAPGVPDPVKNPREYLNYAKFGLDQTTEARVREAVARGRAEGSIDKGKQTFEQQRQQARDFAKKLVDNPLDIDNTKLKNLTGAQVVGLHEVVGENTRLIEAASRAIGSGELSVAEMADAAAVIDRATKSTNEALTTIVREKAQTARSLGFFRQIAKQSVDPEVWLVNAKKMLGDRPMSDELMIEIRRLAKEAGEACG